MLRKVKHYKLAAAYDLLLTFGVPLNIMALFLSGMSTEILSGKQAVGFYGIMAYLYWATVVILGVMNIVQSFRKHKEGDDKYCMNALLILKYGLVLFYVVNYVGTVFVLLIMFVASRGLIIFAFPVVIFYVLMNVAATWLIMIPGSFYGIQVIRFGVKQKKVSGTAAVLHGILQFLFLADVLDTLYLAVKKWGMGKKSSAVVGGLYIFTALAMFATILYIISL